MSANSPTRHRVLVVDDEPHISRIIRTRLEQGPFDVTVVENGLDALKALEDGPDYALAILDLMLPGMSGLEILRAVRESPRWHSLPCIVLTAAGQDQQYHTARELGASDFMTKPFSPRRLMARALMLVEGDAAASPDSPNNDSL